MKRCKACQFLPCRCEDLRDGYMGHSCSTKWKGHRSEALACHPRQIAAIMARNKKHGIQGVSYDADGTCVCESRAAKRALMALEGVHNNQGGYGDDHAGQSPLYREDTVPFDDSLIRESSYYRDGKDRR